MTSSRAAGSRAVDDARRALLERLIDHAALFPPANMDMEAAVAEDRAARASDYGWMIDRFVCPASKLGELDGRVGPLSVVLDTPAPDGDFEAVEYLLGEPRPDPGGLIRLATELRGLAAEVYLELVPGERWRDSIPAAVGAIAAVGGRVKLRCGGAFVPPVEMVALVLVSCQEAGVAMKATAGLHHPLRRGEEHGFLNLLCAATLAHARGAKAPALERVLAAVELAALPLDDLGADEVAAARRRLFKGFGSCSWREPVDDLRELGWLE
jgi:hypothetical protein